MTPQVRGRWFVTPHAVDRYIRRFAPGLTYERAREELILQSESARYVKTFTYGNRAGYELWRGPRPRKFRYWVAPAEGGLPQLVTVMAGHDPGWR